MQELYLWILYAVVGIVAFSLLFLWAVRNRQFSEQERARHLPLHSPQEGEMEDNEESES